ncbi:MAG: BppU family phage baseplate upper protein [Sarcina sp.]
MATLDKNFELSLNLPTAAITSKNMTLSNIDSNVFNIYLQLTIGKGNIVPNANLSEYTCTIIAVKPKTKEFVEQVGVINGESDNIIFDLSNKFNDQVGNYKCEIKVTKGNETITSTPFAYNVTGSVIAQLNAELERNPDIEVLRKLITEVKELVGLKPDDADSLLADYQPKSDVKLNTESKEVVGAINELSSRPHGLYKVDLVPSNNVVNMTSDDVQNVTLTDSATINLPSNINSKEIFLNITCKSRSIIVTFAHGNDTTKVKLAFESYNVFQFSANGNDYMIERKSTKYPTVTPEEEKEGVSTGGLDLSIYQEKDDITLNTKSKSIVSAINEVEDYIQVVKTNGEVIRSNAKIIIDETQDYDSTSFIKDDLTGSDNTWSARKIDNEFKSLVDKFSKDVVGNEIVLKFNGVEILRFSTQVTQAQQNS